MNNEIFEKISAFLKRKGCGFQIVDLRWGINTESALNHNTLEICLDEVNYCMNNSPKPNFLIMAGERYGWIPLPSAVEAGEFERILALCDAGEKEMLFKWYLLDENNIPKVYRLSRRSGEYADDGVWYKEEEKLHEILEKKAKECGFDAETMIKYTSSATEHEILKGLFGNEDIADNVIVLMREGYTERDEDLTKTRELKNRIREKMKKDNLSDNIITLDYNEDYYKAMEERVTALLIKNILSEFERLEAEKEDYIPEKLPEGMFCGRKEDIESLNNYLNGDDRGIYFLTGDSGSGKSTLLKEFIHLCLEYNPEKEYEAELEEAKAKESFKELWAAAKRYMNKKPVDIFCVFFGEDDVYNFYDCLKKLCLMMVKKYDITLGEEINRYNISKMFSEILGNTPSGRIVTIVIDGIDMFYDIGEIKENVFPDRLLKDVKIIVSSANEKIVEKFIKEEDKKYRIESFSKEDAIDSFYKMMASKGRTLAPEKQKKLAEEALSNGANPLSCKLLSDLAAGWRSGDIIETFAFDDYEMAKMHIFDMFESCGHDENIVRYVLSYIAVAPFGITEDDLLTLLFMHKEIKE
ncbi:MAG: ATP-binding protein, partial [Clostridia bacterium]|nr:ATP-binding protein [Clostridia bacterium]